MPDATVIVVDISTAMRAAAQADGSTPADLRPYRSLHKLSLAAAELYLTQKLVRMPTDVVSIVLCGTEGTSNSLHEEGGYEHITEISVHGETMGPISREHLLAVRSSGANGAAGDILDAMVVAAAVMRRGPVPPRTQRRVVVLTGARSALADTDHASSVAQHWKDSKTKLDVHFVGGRVGANPETVRVLEEAAATTGGTAQDVGRLSDVTASTHERARAPNAYYRGPFVIGAGYSLPVAVMARCKSRKPPSLTKVRRVEVPRAGSKRQRDEDEEAKGEEEEDEGWGWGAEEEEEEEVVEEEEEGEGGTVEVLKEVKEERFYVVQGTEVAVPADEATLHFRFGRDIFKLSEGERALIKYAPDRTLELMGFLPRDAVARHRLMGDTEIVGPDPRVPDSDVALRALVEAMDSADRIALARFVPRAKANVILAALFPRLGPMDSEGRRTAGLVLTRLPFSDDMRRFQFRNIDDPSDPLQASEEAAADRLVDSLMLPESRVRAALGGTMNPYLYRLQATATARLVEGDTALIPVAPEVADALHRPPAMDAFASEAMESFRTTFPLVQKAQSRARTLLSSAPLPTTKTDDEEEEEPSENPPTSSTQQSSSKRARTEKSTDGWESSGLGGRATDAPLRVGMDDPIGDFRKMLDCRTDDLAALAIAGLTDVIEQLVDTPTPENIRRAIEAIDVLRSSALAEEETPSFNAWLSSVKGRASRPYATDGLKALWEAVLQRKIGLIDESQDPERGVSQTDAAHFLNLRPPTPPQEPKPPTPLPAAPSSAPELLDDDFLE